MNDEKNLTTEFEAARSHLLSVALRMLGNEGETEDAVQETWLRVSRAGTDGVENLRGWMTTTTARVCLDALRSRKAKREEELAPNTADTRPSEEKAHDPSHETELAESVGVAMNVVLETLAPAERVAFVLHDMFDLSFDDIGSIVGRSPAATRQLASRARRRMQGHPPEPPPDVRANRDVVEAFFVASRGGDLQGLLAVLDPNVVMHPDQTARLASAARKNAGAPDFSLDLHTASGVANAFVGRAKAAELALIDGVPGGIWAPGGVVRTAFVFVVANGRVVEMEVLADPETLRGLSITKLPA